MLVQNGTADTSRPDHLKNDPIAIRPHDECGCLQRLTINRYCSASEATYGETKCPPKKFIPVYYFFERSNLKSKIDDKLFDFAWIFWLRG